MNNLIEELMDGFVGSAYATELNRRINFIKARLWYVGFQNRGNGHGDFAVMVKYKKREYVVVECPCREIADHICKIHNK